MGGWQPGAYGLDRAAAADKPSQCSVWRRMLYPWDMQECMNMAEYIHTKIIALHTYLKPVTREI